MWFLGKSYVQKRIPEEMAERLDQAGKAEEKKSYIEFRWAAEGWLPLRALFSIKRRAHQIFNALGMYKTEQRTGVLLYVAVRSRKFYILADSGMSAKVQKKFWAKVCREMEKLIATQGLEAAMTFAIRQIGAQGAKYFPIRKGKPNVNELPDKGIRG